MPNRMQKAMGQLASRLGNPTTGIGVECTYFKRDGTSIALQGAWQAKTPFRVEDGENSRVIWREFDLMIPVSSLMFDGVKVEPEKGHYISMSFPLPLGVQRFEVSAPNDEPDWRFADQQCTIYRVHFKRMAGA